MKCPKSGEFSGTVNCSHFGVELAPLKIAYAEPDSPSAERTVLRRVAPLLEKNLVFCRSFLLRDSCACFVERGETAMAPPTPPQDGVIPPAACGPKISTLIRNPAFLFWVLGFVFCGIGDSLPE